MDILSCAALAVIESVALRALVSDIDVGPQRIAFIAFGLQYLVLKWYRLFLYPKYFSPWRHLPTPPGNQFMLGHAGRIFKADTPVSLFVEWMESNPDAPFIRYLSLGHSEVLLVNSPSAHREVLQSNCYSFTKTDRLRKMIKQFAGEKSLALLEFDEHRQHRKMLAGILSPASIKQLAPIFTATVKELQNMFDAAIESNDGKTGVIDCTYTYSKATLDAVGISIFGVDLAQTRNAGLVRHDNDNYSFTDAYEDIFAPSTLGKVLFALNAFIPIRWLPLEANQKFMFASRWLNETLAGLVRERRQKITGAIAAGKYDKQSRDLLSFLIEESLPGGTAAGISDRHIADHLLVFLGAGHDSSADMASWSTHIMATRHDIQDRLRAEVLDLVSRNPEPSSADIEALPYLNNFYRESLRVYPPGMTMHRQAATDLTIQGVFIPKGSIFDLAPAVTSMNPLIWGDDAREVNPDRWDAATITSEQLATWSNNVFSNGPRICPGKGFAQLELKLMLFHMVLHYRFLSVEGEFTVENPALTLRPHGLRVRIEKISG
ncbi:Uu.00g103830.m01.CDS01 [Anthostomella pinea]|uniref:Uu.00g103830.m01.CDS01 n=1 Tax=Anthostomella pinea TaxID=933095 RepID=A0AAI8VE49_9PEZI|nr:Uu.00g103830.m01.CDS01 [Anthostomella pinea]